jgi:hypothetical protein
VNETANAPTRYALVPSVVLGIAVVAVSIQILFAASSTWLHAGASTLSLVLSRAGAAFSLLAWIGSIYYWTLTPPPRRSATIVLLCLLGLAIGPYYVLYNARRAITPGSALNGGQHSIRDIRRPVMWSALNVMGILVLIIWRLLGAYGPWVRAWTFESQPANLSGPYFVCLSIAILLTLPAWLAAAIVLHYVIPHAWLRDQTALDAVFLILWSLAVCGQWFAIWALWGRPPRQHTRSAT